MEFEDKTQWPIDLAKLAEELPGGGAAWGHECDDLNLTLLSWPEGQGVAPHINSEVDVAMIGLQGAGEIAVDGDTKVLSAGAIMVIPKGAERSVKNSSGKFSYLNIHGRRRGLMPSVK